MLADPPRRTSGPDSGTPRLLPTIDARRLAELDERLVVDLRSPSEYAEDHVPCAINIPLFDDVERAVIGTLYRKQSPAAAFEEGRRIVEAGVAELVAEVGRHTGWVAPTRELGERVLAMTACGHEGFGKTLACFPASHLGARPVVFHCWRGGLRSRSVVALMRGLGLEAACILEGGYRAWRAGVLRALDGFVPPPTYVLRGLTGVGKTLVLSALERIRPRWTLDLEDLARHRGSILGMVGRTPVSQKRFDSGLRERIARGFDDVLVLEGESRKVGDVIVPARVWSALDEGVDLELVASIDRRVQVLRDDYLASPANAAELAPRLAFLDERLRFAPGEATLTTLFAAGEIDRVVRILLERHYDPLYRHGERGRSFAARFEAEDPERCACEVAQWIGAHVECVRPVSVRGPVE